MKKKYQIEKQRAVQGFRRLAQEENPTVHLMMPMREVAAFLQEGVGHLQRQAGLLLMQAVMDQEVCHLRANGMRKETVAAWIAGARKPATA